MIEGPGERVPVGGLDQGRGLAPQPAVRRSEDQVEDDRDHHGSRQGEDDDLLARLGDPGEQWFRVARDGDDGVDRPFGRDRERFGQGLGGTELWLGRRRDARRGRPAGGQGEVRRRRRARSEAVAREQEHAGGRPHVDPQQVSPAHDERQLGLEGGGADRCQGRGVEVRRQERAVDQDPKERDVGGGHCVERLGRHVR